MIVLLQTLHTVFPVQCLCHTSVDSQEDKRVGVTKIVRMGKRPQEEGTTPSAANTPTPTDHPVCWREEEEAGG